MSKILRRPMFRGGGQVSSYGKGIAAPLVPGYQMGGNVSGGIVNLPGGYAQTANQRLLNNINKDFPNLNVANSGNITLGSELLAAASNKFPKSNAPIPGVVEEDKTTAVEVQDVSPDTSGILDGNGDSLVTGNSDNDQVKRNETTGVLENVDSSDVEPSLEVLRNLPIWAGGITKEEYIERKQKEEISDIQKRLDDEQGNKPLLRGGGEDAGAMTAAEIEDLGLTELEKEAQNITESPEISAKDAIRENQELFKELLGSKKARGQDISDMLLRFSGSQGNTVGEKFQNYTRAESAAGPGRGEKINQTAAALAINDYVAGKRSLEQIDKLKEVERFKNDEAMSRVNITEDDSFRDALNKKAVALKAGTTSSSKVVGETIKDILNIRNDSTPVITVGKTYKNLADINKKIDKIKVGINIIVLKDGSTIVVEKESENSTSVKLTPFKV